MIAVNEVTVILDPLLTNVSISRRQQIDRNGQKYCVCASDQFSLFLAVTAAIKCLQLEHKQIPFGGLQQFVMHVASLGKTGPDIKTRGGDARVHGTPHR